MQLGWLSTCNPFVKFVDFHMLQMYIENPVNHYMRLIFAQTKDCMLHLPMYILTFLTYLLYEGDQLPGLCRYILS